MIAYADDASKTAKVEEFFRLSKMDETFQRSMELVANQVQSGVLDQMMGAQPTPEQKEAIAQLQEGSSVSFPRDLRGKS